MRTRYGVDSYEISTNLLLIGSSRSSIIRRPKRLIQIIPLVNERGREPLMEFVVCVCVPCEDLCGAHS